VVDAPRCRDRPRHGQSLLALNAGAKLPIASLTKTATATWSCPGRTRRDRDGHEQAAAARWSISTLGLVAGERISVEQLLHALLLSPPTTPRSRSPSTWAAPSRASSRS
jgi:hypothetical protein